MRVLITGGAGAIGAGVADRLRKQGATVVGLDLVASENVVACDVRDPAAGVAEAIERLGGGVDVLINNAGIGDAHDAGAAPDVRAEAIMDVNFWGAWRVTAAAMPALLASRGRVINVASGLAVTNMPLAGAYMASKRALAAWSDALRIEYGGRLSAVTTVYPAYIRTPIHDEAAARGVAMDGLVPAEPLRLVVATIARCATRPRPRRDVGSSGVMTAVVVFARVFPGVADAIVVRRSRRAIRRGQFADAPVAKALVETMSA